MAGYGISRADSDFPLLSLEVRNVGMAVLPDILPVPYDLTHSDDIVVLVHCVTGRRIEHST